MSDETPLIDALPSMPELLARQCRALRELELIRRMKKAVERAEIWREADERRRREEAGHA